MDGGSTDGSVKYAQDNGVIAGYSTELESICTDADLIVIAVGMRSVDKIAKELEGEVPILHKIGDCVKAGKVKNAIEAGFQISMKI